MKRYIFLLFLLWGLPAFAQIQYARMLSGVNYVPAASCPYTIQPTDVTFLDVFTSSSACAVTLPAATTPGFGAGTIFSVTNQGTGTVTITPTSGTIKGVANLQLSPGQGADIYSDGGSFSAQNGGNLIGSGVANAVAYWTSPFGLGSVSGTITNSVISVVNGSAPIATVQGLPLGNGNADVSSCPYTIAADSATTTLDRGTTIEFSSAGACSVTLNDPSVSGMGNFFVVKLTNIGAGTVTVNRQTTAVFTVVNGATALTAQTSFTLTTGQYATVHGDNANWHVEKSSAGGSGTVTSVSFTGGVISVATPTTTPAFTVAGTSGGIPYFSAASTWASSALLTQYGVVYGGGSGAAPVSTAADTNTTHAFFATATAPAFRALAGTDLPAQYTKLECSPGLGDGLNAMPAGTYLQFNCVNRSGVTWTIVGINCWTDNNGTSTLQAANNAGTNYLTGAVTCNNTKSGGGAAGTQSGTTTIPNNDAMSFTFVADGTSKQTTWTVSMTQ
jgi:hypothetical protein